VSVVVRVVPGLPGVETSVPLVSFSINTPFLVAVRFVVDVTSSWYVGATPGVVTVVVLEEDDCAKPTPDINVRAVVAARKVLNIACSPRNIWRAESPYHDRFHAIAGAGSIIGNYLCRAVPDPDPQDEV
jgi:hypothetical protein